jgi:hypothetical protein
MKWRFLARLLILRKRKRRQKGDWRRGKKKERRGKMETRREDGGEDGSRGRGGATDGADQGRFEDRDR